MSDDRIRALAEAVLTRCREKKLMIATAESCTGGLIAGALTDIAGSSDVVERGFVTYSNRAKTEMLGVPAALIAWHGAVSAEVARAMAAGALAHAPVDLTVAVTGIAGPAAARRISLSGSCISVSRAKASRCKASITCFPAIAPAFAKQRSCARWSCCWQPTEQ